MGIAVTNETERLLVLDREIKHFLGFLDARDFLQAFENVELLM